MTDLILMNDFFKPVAIVMTELKGIELPPWKTHNCVKKLVKWLEDASLECHENGNFHFFPTMNENEKVNRNFIKFCFLWFCPIG